MSRVSTERCRLRAAVLLLPAAVAILVASGCWRVAKTEEPGAGPPPPSGAVGPRDGTGADNGAPPPRAGEAPPLGARPGDRNDAEATPRVPDLPAPAAEMAQNEKAAGPAPAPPPAAGEAAPPPAPPPAADEAAPAPIPGAPEPAKTTGPPSPAIDNQGKSVENVLKPRVKGEDAAAREGAAKGPEGGGGRIVGRLPDHLAFDQSGPRWARGREELVYRVEFLGITMGYARFVFNGKVLLNGREVYHLSVRAWTANVLALIYPINDTIDYYMDVRTLQPLRQEYTSGNRKKDDVMVYNQETGRIVYRYKQSGEIRKEVDAVPNIYDPVTLAYLFRCVDPERDGKARNVYAGRKVWEISAQPLGFEKIVTERGEVETIVVRPVIKREGKLENKGDLRMWMTRDERKIPVRLYAKFKKWRTWTLVGELMPEGKGG